MRCKICNLTNANTRLDGAFRVVNNVTGEVVESHPCEHLAKRAADAMNSHEQDHNRPRVYRADKGSE